VREVFEPHSSNMKKAVSFMENLRVKRAGEKAW
jgi:hypothetical protein